MATTTLDLPSSTYAEAYQKIYESIPQQTIEPTQITLNEQTKESIAADISSYLRPYYDAAADQREKTAVQNRAELDTDAYSRGMGSSTWLTDKKSREAMSAASDIASINAQYGAALNEGVNTQFQNYTANKLAVEQQNTANRLSADQYNLETERAAREWAYQVLLNQISLGTLSSRKSGGSSSGVNTGFWDTDADGNVFWNTTGVPYPQTGPKTDSSYTLDSQSYQALVKATGDNTIPTIYTPPKSR